MQRRKYEKRKHRSRNAHGGSDVAYIHAAGSGTATARDKISKSRVAAVKRSRKRGHNWRLAALLHSRRIDRAPEDPGVCFVCVSYAKKNSIARALPALARVATPNDISRRRHAGAQRSQKRNAGQLANRKRDRRFRALGINIRRRRVRAIEKTQLTKPAPLFGIKPGPLCARNILSRAHARYTW